VSVDLALLRMEMLIAIPCRLLTAAGWRMCVVLKEPLNGSVHVTYTATFKRASALPLRLDHTLWYPVAPAETGGGREPLPSVNNTAQWVSLRRVHVLGKAGSVR
jgi:hypothetical protein